MKFRGLLSMWRKSITGTLLLVILCDALGASLLTAVLRPLTVEAAQVVISSTPDTTAAVHTQLGSALVFIDDQVGYKFYRFGAAPSTGMCGYSKTTNGGNSWGTFVPVDNQTDCIGISVWYDQWTPGDSGTNIHIVTIDTGNDEMFYNRLNTSGDTLLVATAVTACSACAGTYAAGANEPSITKAVNGILYIVTDDGNGTNIRRCTTNCGVSGSWTAVGTAPQGNADSFSLLMPVGATNVMLINRSTTNVLRFSSWNGTIWSSFQNIDASAIQNTTYDVGMAATIDVDTGDLYLAYAADNNDFVTADHDIRTAYYDGSSWTAKANVLSNVSGRGVLQVGITRDQNNGDIYVGYSIRNTIGTAATGNVYAKQSTDGMTTWGSELGTFSTTAGDLYGFDMNLMSFERLYATWFNVTVGNDVYGDTIFDTGPQVTLSSLGTQLSQSRANVTSVYAGGTFLLESLASYSVSSFVVTESGTINAQNDLSNIKLYYKADTTSPYDCASESHSATSTQFGATASAFSGSDGTASFTNAPITVSPTNSLCFFVVYDIDATALNGATIELSVANPATDVIVSGGIEVFPSSAISLPGTTTIVAPNLTQFGFHWRLDNGSEITASSATAGVEDTALSAVQIGSGRRIRVGVANQGSTSTLASTYELQYAEAAPTCADASSWTNVGSSGAAWVMQDSANIVDGNNTTNISTTSGGLTDLPSTSFIAANAALKDTSATTSSILLGVNQFIEFEYSIVATSTAVEGSTYCFRMAGGGSPLAVYSEYPRATIAADVLVQSFGTQIATTAVQTLSVYAGGGFRIIENSASRNVTDITITELGTVDGTTGLDNIRLYYDLDTSDPYDCSSESYLGTETQFGATSSTGFSGGGETVTMSGSVGITTTATMCVYVVYDVTGTAENGDTIEIAIGTPSADVVVSGGGSVGPSSQVEITGSTTIQGPLLNQLHYHWRNDNGSEVAATSMTGGSEDTLVTEFAQETPIRLRLSVTNTGLTTSAATRFRLEYAPRITTCDVATVWTDVNASADGWDMYNSTFLTNGETTTNIAVASGGVSNGVGLFIGTNGGVRDTESLSGTTTIPVNDYVELEYSLTSTAFTSYGTTYCFRVSAYDTPLAIYSEYAELTTAPKRDFKIQRGSTQVSGTATTLIAGTNYTAPASTSRAFVRITNAHQTGAGHTVFGAQNADDTTVYISNPGNLATSFTLSRPAAAINTTRVDWEIVEFIGQPDTDNEIIVHSVGTVNYTTATVVATGTAVTGITDDADVVVFVTGIENQNASRNYYAGLVTSEWASSTDQPVFRRGANGASVVNVSYAVVEFKGVNWSVQRAQHAYTAAGVTETESITPVNSLARTFLHTQKRMGATTNVVHFGHEVWLSSIGAISFQLETGASVAVEQTSVAWVIENTQTSLGAMVVQRSNGNTTGGTTPLSLSITLPTAIAATNNTSIMGTARAAGANTTYPRPQAGFTITSTTTYQIWRSDTGSLLTYRVELIEWPVADLSVRQNYYRFYVDNNALTPTDPWPTGFADLGENTSLTIADEPLGTGDRLRVRMTLRVTNANVPAGFMSFKLQYGLRSSTCSAISSGNWFAVGQTSSSTVWRGFAATGTSDGTSLSTNPADPGDLLISVADIAGSLEHENISVANPYPANDGENIEYDWYIEHNGAIPQSTYCFRLVRSDDTPLEGYNFYPQIRTAGFTPVTQNWRWYDDVENETPTSALGVENAAPIDIADTDTLALRVSVYERRNVQGENIKFKLQFSDDATFANPIDVVSTSSCAERSLWCYVEGGGSDNQIITTQLLSDGDGCTGGIGFGCGRHNASANPASGHVHYGHAAQEYSFTVRNVAARVKAVYYFRLYDITNDAPVGLGAGEDRSSLVTEGPILTLSLGGLPSGTTTAGVVTDVSSAPDSVGFGSLTFNDEYIAAHRVGVTTNATEGYQVLAFARQQLVSSHGMPIPSVTGTNASPTSWSTGCMASSTGCIGYHTTDATLREGSTRFAPIDTYAGLETDPVEVMYSSIPSQDSHDIVYRIRVSELQPAGDYETEIVYLAVPSY
jgi:hypothetical protein